jgi:hypothetical protein
MPKHHGIVASNEKLTDEIQGLVATVLAAKQGNAAVK